MRCLPESLKLEWLKKSNRRHSHFQFIISIKKVIMESVMKEWVDQKLKWNTSDFANITILRIPCDLIWLPDIVLYNSVENHNKGYMKSLAMVEHNGKVFWPPIVRMRSSCKMDITYFPFDDQICTLKLGSWAYDGLQVDVTNRTVNIDLSNYVDNGEWQLMDTRIVRNVKYYQCCPEPFPDVVFYLHIRRRILYYLLNVIIPCMLLSSLSLTGFLLPPDSGEKVTLGLTVLLAFSVFMLLVAENMPPTSEYVPLVGIYLTVIMAMSALSVALSVFVLNCHHRGAMLHRPHPIVRLVALAIARMMCMSLRYLNKGPYRRCASNNLTSPCGRQPSSIFGHTTSSSYLENGLHELNSPTDNEEECNDQHHQHHQHQQQQHVIHQHYQHQNHHNHNNQSCLSQHNNIQQHRQHVIDLGLNGLVGDWSRPADGTAPSTANSQHTGNGGGVGGTPQACAGRTEREILLYLRAVLEAHERGKLERVAVCEWQEVARVMDKLFFWIFVIVTFSLDRRSAGHLAHDKERQRARTVRTSVCFIHDHKTSSYQNNDVVQAPSFTAVLFAKPARRPLIPLHLSLLFAAAAHANLYQNVVVLVETSSRSSLGRAVDRHVVFGVIWKMHLRVKQELTHVYLVRHSFLPVSKRMGVDTKGCGQASAMNRKAAEEFHGRLALSSSDHHSLTFVFRHEVLTRGRY
ncbi:hypothetical protein C0Q70_20297 [Pomacea canaliculata]|uniref:Neurotransmitter-gated ion-channel ligand-binding domain-containing protein n=1 Tax=Pomacea canaliculata TaxID=400727 RepID=A0A2T7NF69_POMCA|nr:hypothetical protein C0Q70_20297 [Pomacea canaliculata]